MDILVIGAGGREHAICWKLRQSPQVDKIYCAPGNGGIAQIAECVDIGVMDFDALVAFAKEKKIDLTVVAPDDPLVAGAVDVFEQNGLTAFGPRANAAVIEGSKVFSKELMKKYQIPTAKYEVFDNSRAALAYIEKQTPPIVIKAEGLALGKGVIIAQSLDEAKQAVLDIMEHGMFGKAGNRIVIEEFLTGPEVSVLAFCDGKTVKPMVSAQDHKRAYDQDKGPNTGGMGTFSPSRIYTEELAQECMKTVFQPTVDAMRKDGRAFQGVLYFGLMLTKDGMKVIEYNCRFGDPEAQVVLPRLKSDLVAVMMACVNGTLDQTDIEWDDGAAVCVVMASGGYPKQYETEYPISGLDEVAKLDDVVVFHAGTKDSEQGIVTSGGRVLGVTALETDLESAIARAYQSVKLIHFQNAHYRTDIGIK